MSLAALVEGHEAGGGRRRTTLALAIAGVALLVVAVVVITSKNLPVQSSLWLVPLVALAGVPWRDHLVWAAAEVAAARTSDAASRRRAVIRLS